MRPYKILILLLLVWIIVSSSLIFINFHNNKSLKDQVNLIKTGLFSYVEKVSDLPESSIDTLFINGRETNNEDRLNDTETDSDDVLTSQDIDFLLKNQVPTEMWSDLYRSKIGKRWIAAYLKTGSPLHSMLSLFNEGLSIEKVNLYSENKIPVTYWLMFNGSKISNEDINLYRSCELEMNTWVDYKKIFFPADLMMKLSGSNVKQQHWMKMYLSGITISDINCYKKYNIPSDGWEKIKRSKTGEDVFKRYSNYDIAPNYWADICEINIPDSIISIYLHCSILPEYFKKLFEANIITEVDEYIKYKLSYDDMIYCKKNNLTPSLLIKYINKLNKNSIRVLINHKVPEVLWDIWTDEKISEVVFDELKMYNIKPENYLLYINKKYLRYDKPVYNGLPFPNFSELYDPNNISAMVNVKCNVDKDGFITDYMIFNPVSSCVECMNKVQNVIDHARFIPAYLNGRRVAGEGYIIIYFRE